MPHLCVLLLSDSFSEAWPALASECGLGLVTSTDPSAFGCPDGVVGALSAAGVEESVEATLRRIKPEGLEVAAVGAVPDHRLAVSAVLAGAAQYFVLPPDYQLLRSWLCERAERALLRRRGSAFAAGEAAKYRFEETLGQSPALREALERAARIIPHPGVAVLVTGETGTGKELLARAIHYNGPRRDAPFVDVNCAAIPEQLMESELFGHERGAFTGATSAKPGLFEVAQGGSLFLDEIGHLSLALQGKLLRVLQERTVRRVGGTRPITIDVRIIAATHVDLGLAVSRKEFREDLYHRLNVMPIKLPPLRARREDILMLARHFLARFAKEYDLPEPGLTYGAGRALRMHPWTGNIRELRNVMERALLLGAGRQLDTGDLELDTRPAPVADGAIPFPASLDEITRGAVKSMIELCGGNKSDAARRLGISRTRILRMLNGTGENLVEHTTQAGGQDEHAQS